MILHMADSVSALHAVDGSYKSCHGSCSWDDAAPHRPACKVKLLEVWLMRRTLMIFLTCSGGMSSFAGST